MTAIQPPLYIGVDGEIGADELGLPYADLISEGIVAAGDLAVAQRAAGANMSVDVAKGAAWVKGDTDADAQPTYRVRNDATVNVVIPGADASKPRIDRVVARVFDSAFAGTSLTWDIEVVEGVATTGATLTNLSGAAAVPATALLLANVLVPAAASSIVTADLSDQRVQAVAGGGKLARSIYGKTSADVSSAGTTFAAGADVLTKALSFDADGSSDYVVEISARDWQNTGTGNRNLLHVNLDGADAGIMADGTLGAANFPYPCTFSALLVAPAAGRHTVNVRLGVTAGTGKIEGGAGGVNTALPIRVAVRKA